jgi:hypothetical protein
MAVRPGVGFGGLYEQPFLDGDKVSKPWYDFLIGLTARANSSGTVTDLTGNLTANELVVGNGTQDLKVLGTLGTVHTLLHGNAAGLPAFSAVDLTADVGNALPPANGGTGATSVPSNGQLPIGNGTVYVPAALTAGAGISVTNGAGSVTIASQPGIIKAVSIFTNAQILATPTTALVVVPAQGAGTTIVPLYARFVMDTSAGAYTNIDPGTSSGTGGSWEFAIASGGTDVFSYLVNRFGGLTVDSTQTLITQFLGMVGKQLWEPRHYGAPKDPTDNTTGPYFFQGWGLLSDPTITPVTDSQNQPLILFVSNGALGNYTGGNAANTLTATVLYMVVTP